MALLLLREGGRTILQGPTRTPGHPLAPSPKVTEATCPRPALGSILETRHSLLGKTGKEEPASRSGHLLRCPIYSLCTQGLKHGSTCSTQSPLLAAVRRGGSPHLPDNMPMSGPRGNFKEPPRWEVPGAVAPLGCACRSGVLPTASRGYFESAASAWLQHRGGFLGCAPAPSAFSSPPSGLDGSGPQGFRAALIGPRSPQSRGAPTALPRGRPSLLGPHCPVAEAWEQALSFWAIGG